MLWLILVSTVLAGSAQAAPGVCVSNGTDQALLFVAEAKGAPQRDAILQPGQTLCSGAGKDPGGVVRVFTDANATEGCSRLVSEGETETLMDYVDFDRCRWSSHDQ
jgi:hypothetical protein